MTQKLKMKKETKSLTEAEKKKIKSDLKKTLDLAGKNYDLSVTLLLRTISKAEKEKDLEAMKNCRRAAEAWLGFFNDLNKQIDKNSPMSVFAKDQIKFFEILVSEIDKALAERKYEKIRKKLE